MPSARGRQKRKASRYNGSSGAASQSMLGSLELERTEPGSHSGLEEWASQMEPESYHTRQESHHSMRTSDAGNEAHVVETANANLGTLSYRGMMHLQTNEGDSKNPLTPELTSSGSSGNNISSKTSNAAYASSAGHSELGKNVVSAPSSNDNMWKDFESDFPDIVPSSIDWHATGVDRNVSAVSQQPSSRNSDGSASAHGTGSEDVSMTTVTRANAHTSSSMSTTKDGDSPAELNLRRQVESLKAQLQSKTGEIQIVRERLKQETEKASELQDLLAVSDLESRHKIKDIEAQSEKKIQQMKSEVDFKDTELQEAERKKDAYANQLAKQSKELEQLKNQIKGASKGEQLASRKHPVSVPLKMDEEDFWQNVQAMKDSGGDIRSRSVTGVSPHGTQLPVTLTSRQDHYQVEILVQKYPAELSYIMLTSSSTCSEVLGLYYPVKLVYDRKKLIDDESFTQAANDIVMSNQGSGSSLATLLKCATNFKSILAESISGREEIVAAIPSLCALAGLYSRPIDTRIADVLEDFSALNLEELNSIVALRLCALRILLCLLENCKACRRKCIGIKSSDTEMKEQSFKTQSLFSNRLQFMRNRETEDSPPGWRSSESLANLRQQLENWSIGETESKSFPMGDIDLTSKYIVAGLIRFGNMVSKITLTTSRRVPEVKPDSLVMMYNNAWECATNFIKEDIPSFVEQLTTTDTLKCDWDDTSPLGTLFFGAHGAVATGLHGLANALRFCTVMGNGHGNNVEAKEIVLATLTWVSSCLQNIFEICRDILRLKYSRLQETSYTGDTENDLEQDFRLILLDLGPLTAGISDFIHACLDITPRGEHWTNEIHLRPVILQLVHSSLYFLVSLQYRFQPHASLCYAGTVTSQICNTHPSNLHSSELQPPMSWTQAGAESAEEILEHLVLLPSRVVALIEEYTKDVSLRVESLRISLAEVSWRIARLPEFKLKASGIRDSIEPAVKLLKLALAVITNMFVDVGPPFLYRLHGWQGPLLNPNSSLDAWTPEEGKCGVQVITKAMHSTNSFRMSLEKIQSMIFSLGYDSQREISLRENIHDDVVQSLLRISSFGSGLRFMLHLIDSGILSDIQGLSCTNAEENIDLTGSP